MPKSTQLCVMLLKKFFTLKVTMKKPNTCELFLLGISKVYYLETKEDLKWQKAAVADYTNCFKALPIKQFRSF